MIKSTRIVKRILVLFLVVLMSIESFGAVVSDNDGSAFITKAEFDSLKNNFQSQIDQYNTSIDSKIDGAIAQYLAGVKIKKTVSLIPVISQEYEYLESFGWDNQLPLRSGHILGKMKCIQGYLCHIGDTGNNGFFQGLIDTDYVSNGNSYYNTVMAKNMEKKFYNLKLESLANVYTDYIAVGYDKWNGNIRFDNPDINLICGVTGYYWYGNSNTHRVRMQLQRTYNLPHNLAVIVDSDNWVRADDSPQEYVFDWDTSLNKYVAYQSANCPQTGTGTTRYDNVTGFAYVSNPSQLIGFGWETPYHHHTASSRWIYGANNMTTLATFYNVPYTYIAVYWPVDLSKSYINMLLTDQIQMSDMKWSISVSRALYQDDNNNWQTTTDRKYHVYPSTTHNNDNLTLPTIAKGVNAYGDENNFQAVPYDWTYETFYLADGYDQRNINYYDTEILNDNLNEKLNNYIRNYTTSRGFPMYVIEQEGTIKISPEFVDNTKKYKIWFTKGPALTSDIETTKPTNCYNITGANADGSITYQNGQKITFEVEKDDIIYMSWTEENKKGGGKLKYPLNAELDV